MIPALQKDQDFLNDVKHAKKHPDHLHLWWLGQSGFLVQYRGTHLLIDPYLSDSLTAKYAGSDKPHIRMTERVIDPSRLDFIDTVTSSHNHTDHLDGMTLKSLLEVNPEIEILVPEANREFAAKRLDVDPNRLTTLMDGNQKNLKNDIVVHGIPAAHNEISRDENGNCQFMGYVFQVGPYTIYHSGDSLLRDEIVKSLSKFSIDIALLPINGNIRERRVAGNLNAREAIELSRKLNFRMVVPCHYHMFTFNTVEPDEFIRLAEEYDQDITVLKSGERLSYSKLP